MRQEGSNMLSMQTNGCVTAPTFIILVVMNKDIAPSAL